MFPGDSCLSTVATMAFHDTCCRLVGPASADSSATARFGLLASLWCNACRGSPPANPCRAVCRLIAFAVGYFKPISKETPAMTSKPSDSLHQGVSTGCTVSRRYSVSTTAGVAVSDSLDEPSKTLLPLAAICTEFAFGGQGSSKGSSLQDLSFAFIVSREGVHEVSLRS